MNLNDLHRRLLQDVLEIGNAFPFVWAQAWADDINRRLFTETYVDGEDESEDEDEDEEG